MGSFVQVEEEKPVLGRDRLTPDWRGPRTEPINFAVSARANTAIQFHE
jgi:hypothetical protein